MKEGGRVKGDIEGKGRRVKEIWKGEKETKRDTGRRLEKKNWGREKGNERYGKRGGGGVEKKIYV